MSVSFIHLNVHSEYSLVDGIVRIKPLVAAAKSSGMPAVAITDHCNLFGMVKFYSAAIAAGIKPIVGADVLWQFPDDEQLYHLILLCQNQQGYKNLTRLVSRAYVEGQKLGKPIIQYDWFTGNTDGLIALSGARDGDIGHALLSDNSELAISRLKNWQQLFIDRFYIELQRTGRHDENKYVPAAVALAEQQQVPVVATNNVCFLSADDFEAHEARVCINSGYVLEDKGRPHLYSDQQYFRSSEDMQELFSDIPEALQNTVEIAKRCNLLLELGKVYLPQFPTPNGMSLNDYLDQESKVGLEKRLRQLFDLNADNFNEIRNPYDDRLNIELGVIKEMGFPGYFLIVADFIQWAKNNAIPVGPGRGSGAGSLVAYALGITDLDPLALDLLFERFLNPERVSMPDFDIDFCMEGRDRVIEYVANKYGRQSVSQIITYGSMAAKAVVRDVGRVLNHPYGFVDKIAKLIPFELGITLTKALQQDETLLNRYHDEEEVKYLIDLAMKLEGITRNAGKHAGGVVIAPSLLTDFVPLFCEEGGDNLVTQFDKDDVESVGLVKFDFLGLRTLTIINWALQTVNQQRKLNAEEPIDILNIPLDDPAVFKELKRCNTTAVFQLESRGMKDLVKRLQPDSFEEIVALVALFRPGPLQSGMVDDFIDRKHGRAKVSYPHPALEPILKTTYGVILYQEQVMKIAQDLAGYSLGAADILRRAMGKKKPEEMAKQRAIFLEGSEKNNIDGKVANFIFDLMEKFAGYGFNKSHSAAYALLSYQTAWLKTHYTEEFMAAVLSSDMDNTDKVVAFIEDCAQNNLRIAPPDINASVYKFAVQDDTKISYGLGAIKGVGESAINLIIEERLHSKFENLFDFCQRVDTRKVNRRVIEALIKSGAMDGFNVHRASLHATIDRALAMAEQKSRDALHGQQDLFGSIPAVSDDNKYLDVPEWPTETRLEGEKDTLGLYVTGHPLDAYREELSQFVNCKIAELSTKVNGSITMAGFVANMRTMMTKKGSRMAFLSLDDGTGRAEVALFSDTYEQNRHLLAKGKLLVVTGDVSVDDYSGGYRIKCSDVMDLDNARQRFAKGVLITFNFSDLPENIIDQLKAILKPFLHGECPVCLHCQHDGFASKLLLGDGWRITPQPALLHQLRELFGSDAVTVKY